MAMEVDVIRGERAADSQLPNPANWQQEMRQAYRDPAELCRDLRLDPEIGRLAEESAGGFPLFAPRPFVQRIRPGDSCDPLLRQILPVADELSTTAGFGTDPVADQASTRIPGSNACGNRTRSGMRMAGSKRQSECSK